MQVQASYTVWTFAVNCVVVEVGSVVIADVEIAVVVEAVVIVVEVTGWDDALKP